MERSRIEEIAAGMVAAMERRVTSPVRGAEYSRETMFVVSVVHRNVLVARTTDVLAESVAVGREHVSVEYRLTRNAENLGFR